jgi:hypothetical protein
LATSTRSLRSTLTNKSLSFRKEEEEKRRREEEALIGNVYKEFEEHFDDRPTAKLNKTWVKAGTFNAGKKRGHSLLPELWIRIHY